MYRPLSEQGHQQAQALARFFADNSISSLLSSPATRCVQTIEPLAQDLGLTVAEHDELWEDAGLQEFMTLINHVAAEPQPGSGGIVICTHGNLIPSAVEQLGDEGVSIHGRGCERASIWVLRTGEQGWAEARYLSPRSGYE